MWCAISIIVDDPDSNVHMANTGPTWGRQDPDGPHVSPIHLAIRDVLVLNGTRMYVYLLAEMIFIS